MKTSPNNGEARDRSLTKRLLGLLVNSSGSAHARNARKLVQASRKQDRRLAAALLAAALAHTPEAEEVLRGARTRMSRKPQALARELLRNFPKRRGKASRRKRRKGGGEEAEAIAGQAASNGARAVDSAAPVADQPPNGAAGGSDESAGESDALEPARS